MEQEITKSWRNVRFNNNTENNTPRRQTALQQLIERYKRFSRFALIMAGCMPLSFFNILRSNSDASLGQISAISVYIIVYCLIASIMDRWIARGLSTINLAEMPAVEVFRRALFYRKRHFQFMAVLMPMCLILLGWIVWLFSDDEYFLYGVATGAAIGVVIGVIILSRFLREYKELTM